ncbi:MAG: hypothetical protein ACO26C_08715 [Ilumatobacteraceae bacterium]
MSSPNLTDAQREALKAIVLGQRSEAREATRQRLATLGHIYRPAGARPLPTAEGARKAAFYLEREVDVSAWVRAEGVAGRARQVRDRAWTDVSLACHEVWQPHHLAKVDARRMHFDAVEAVYVAALKAEASARDEVLAVLRAGGGAR